MQKCVHCKNIFIIPKGRKVCYLCEECRRIAIEEDNQFMTLDTMEKGETSRYYYDGRSNYDEC